MGEQHDDIPIEFLRSVIRLAIVGVVYKTTTIMSMPILAIFLKIRKMRQHL